MTDNTRYEQWIGSALQALSATPTKDNLTRLALCYLDAAEYYAVARCLHDCYYCIKCAELLSCSSNVVVKKVIEKNNKKPIGIKRITDNPLNL